MPVGIEESWSGRNRKNLNWREKSLSKLWGTVSSSWVLLSSNIFDWWKGSISCWLNCHLRVNMLSLSLTIDSRVTIGAVTTKRREMNATKNSNEQILSPLPRTAAEKTQVFSELLSTYKNQPILSLIPHSEACSSTNKTTDNIKVYLLLWMEKVFIKQSRERREITFLEQRTRVSSRDTRNKE